MPKLDPFENFEPSSEVKKAWLHTPKGKPRPVANILVPGLFKTEGYERVIWVAIAILLLELLVLYIIFSIIGELNYIVYFGFALLIIDFVLALWSHKDQDDIVYKKNQIVIEDDEVVVSSLQRELSHKLRFQKIVFGLIYFLAIVKILAFYIIYGDTDVVLFFVCFIFLLVAYLHTKFTGYIYFTEFLYKNKFRKQHNSFLDSKGGGEFSYDKTKPREHDINGIKLVPAKQGQQEIIQVVNKDNEFKLLTYGILTDEQLLELVARQASQEQARKVLKEGIRHQLKILNLNANATK